MNILINPDGSVTMTQNDDAISDSIQSKTDRTMEMLELSPTRILQIIDEHFAEDIPILELSNLKRVGGFMRFRVQGTHDFTLIRQECAYLIQLHKGPKRLCTTIEEIVNFVRLQFIDPAVMLSQLDQLSFVADNYPMPQDLKDEMKSILKKQNLREDHPHAQV